MKDNSNDNLNSALVETILGKLEDHDRKMHGLPNLHKDITALQEGIRHLQTSVNRLYVPTKEMKELGQQLTENIRQSQQPKTQRIHHTFELKRNFWLLSTLIGLVVVLSIGLVLTIQNKNKSTANDLRYRYLKLRASKSEIRIFHQLDSVDIDQVYDSVIQWEREEYEQYQIWKRIEKGNEEATQNQKALDELQSREHRRRK